MLLAQAQRSVLHPLDTIKSRLQYLRDTAPRARSGWRKVPILADIAGMAHWPREHFTPRSLYRGLLPSLLGALPMSLVYMPTYELSKQALAQTPAAPLAGVVTGAVRASLPGPPTPPPRSAEQPPCGAGDGVRAGSDLRGQGTGPVADLRRPACRPA